MLSFQVLFKSIGILWNFIDQIYFINSRKRIKNGPNNEVISILEIGSIGKNGFGAKCHSTFVSDI